MLRQATNPQSTPGLDQPAYAVLRRAGEYEVRRYAPYVVAEVGMPASAPPASGAPAHSSRQFGVSPTWWPRSACPPARRPPPVRQRTV